MAQLFSKQAKPVIDIYETPNVVYHFRCTGPTCGTYVGQTEKPLIKRIEQHQQFCHARGIYFHIENCEIYKSKFDAFVEAAGSPKPNSRKFHDLRIEFLKSHFTILEKNFANSSDRLNAESYYIRSLRPRLNEQKYHKAFDLF